jgi:hypothetical protein
MQPPLAHFPLVLWLLCLSLLSPAAPTPHHTLPAPLPEHPGNIFIEGEKVLVRLPENRPTESTGWKLFNDAHQLIQQREQAEKPAGPEARIALGRLPVGWYRLEFGKASQTNGTWTTLAVLPRLRAEVPLDSPIAVDSAASWFAQDDPSKQERFANLAALAGVRWVRDRLRWGEIQPKAGPLKNATTTYDTSAEAHKKAGLELLQVFHDTPAWARAPGTSGGRFAPDLRHVYELGRQLALRYKGRVAAWEPWNEANIATFGGHTVDQMCSWQKAAWLGFKAGDPGVLVGWNVTAATPTPAHTAGVIANETWPYFDTYNIHTYDWPHDYLNLWKPAREAACGRPLWITEADRGTPHLKNPPWYDQNPRLERLKAEWIAQSYAQSLFAGAARHFHFILGNYQEPNGVQFGLLRHDLTPRPAYVALAAVGRYLAGAKVLGRWQPQPDAEVYAFRAVPNGKEQDVLVAWTEGRGDWQDRGKATVRWMLPAGIKPRQVVDYLGRPQGTKPQTALTSAPVFILLRPGQAQQLPLQPPPSAAARREGTASPAVLQVCWPEDLVKKVEDLPWSEGYAYCVGTNMTAKFRLQLYNFSTAQLPGRISVSSAPAGWKVSLDAADLRVAPGEFVGTEGTLQITPDSTTRDGWVVLRAEFATLGSPVVAFRVLAH